LLKVGVGPRLLEGTFIGGVLKYDKQQLVSAFSHTATHPYKHAPSRSRGPTLANQPLKMVRSCLLPQLFFGEGDLKVKKYSLFSSVLSVNEGLQVD